jgi:hypothetical protein
MGGKFETSGTVVDGRFLTKCGQAYPRRLTVVTSTVDTPAESGEISLASYEGQPLVIRYTHMDSEWVYGVEFDRSQ